MTKATNETEAVQLVEKLAHGLAKYKHHMTSGYMTISVGAGNPDYFWSIIYVHDGYDKGGWAMAKPPKFEAHGPTLMEAINRLQEAMAAANAPDGDPAG